MQPVIPVVDLVVSPDFVYSIDKDASLNEHIQQMRLSATKALMEREDAVIVASVSCIYGLGDPELYFSMILHLSRGERVSQRDIIRQLTDMQYKRNDVELFRRDRSF